MMEREFAKWILDIAKYVVTALLLSNIFGNLSDDGIYALGATVVLMCLGLGLYILRRQDKKDKQREKNRNKNKNRR